MRRWARFVAMLVLLGSQTGCLPSNFFENLLGDSIYAVTGVVLSDAVNTILPPTN